MGRDINRILREAPKESKVPDLSRYSSHDFRRGSAQELKESGPHLPIAASVGEWSALCLNGYVAVPT